jgi:hypothetical protein
MSDAAGAVTIQLDSQLANKLTNEHYELPLKTPVRIPYLSQPRVSLEALSFSNSFTNVDGVRMDNNKVRLAWKVHNPTDKNKRYDALEWKYLELTINNSFQTAQTLEAEIARQIHQKSSEDAVFGEDLWKTMNRMVSNKPTYLAPKDPVPLNTHGQRPPAIFRFSTRCWFYGAKAQYFFPEASGAANTIVVVVDAPVDHEKDYTSANNFGGATAGLTFRETYVGGADSGTLHWYDAVPDFLIGSSLQSVRNPLDTGGTYPGHAEGKDITGDLAAPGRPNAQWRPHPLKR